MLPVQTTYKAALSAGKTPEMTELAKKNDAKSHALLNGLRKRPENSVCADCTAKNPGWAALPHGVFVCIDCAQLHRNLGRHLSQVKAINTGTYLWYEHEIKVMQEMGNARAEKLYLGGSREPVPKPNKDASPETKDQYVRDKYERCRWKLGDLGKLEQQQPQVGASVPASSSATTQGSPAVKPATVPRAALPRAPPASDPRKKPQLPKTAPKLASSAVVKPAAAAGAAAVDWDQFDPFGSIAPSAPAVASCCSSTGSSAAGTVASPAPVMEAPATRQHQVQKDAIMSLYGTPAPPLSVVPPAGNCHGQAGRGFPQPAPNFFAAYGL